MASIGDEEEFQSSNAATIRKRSGTPHPQPRKRAKRTGVTLPTSLDPNLFCRTQKPQRYCNGCSKIPLSPFITTCDCKAVYCEACAKKAPRCSRHPHQEIIYIPDKALKSKISKLKIRLCPYHQRGCTWEGGEVFRLRQHMSECQHSNNKKKARSKKDAKESSLITPTIATPGNHSDDTDVIVLSPEYDDHQDESTTITTTNSTITQLSHSSQIQLPPILPIESATYTASLQGYESMPDTPSTVNQPETGQVPALRGSGKNRDSHDATQASVVSIKSSITPPRFFDMTSVSTYQGLSILHWTSPTFSSCEQLGYRLNVVTRISQDDSFALNIAVKSAQDRQNHHLKFPCSGTAKMLILNPHSNSDHVKCSVKFELQFPSNEVPDFAVENSVKFPKNFVDNDSLYLQVSEVELEGSGRPWLMNPYLTIDSGL